MKKILLAAFLASLVSLVGAQPVRVGVFVHVPHVYKAQDSDTPYGPAVDYITKVLLAMGYTPKISLLPFPRILTYLKSGELDVTLEIAKTEERETYLLYAKKPAYRMVKSLTFLATNPINEIRTIDDLAGMRIGYLLGANLGTFLESSNSIQVEYVGGDDWVRLNLAKLLSGRIDAALDNNAYSYLAEAKRQGVMGTIKTLPLPGEVSDYYVAFSKKSARGAELVRKYDELMETGRFNEQEMLDAFLRK